MALAACNAVAPVGVYLEERLCILLALVIEVITHDIRQGAATALEAT